MEKSLLKAYIKNIISESLTPDQVNKVEDKYNSIYSGMLKGNKKKLMKYVDPKFNRPNPDAMAMGRAINLVKKETETVNESFSQEDWDIKWKMPKDNLFNVTKTTDAVNNRYKALQSLLKSKPEELRVFDADENHPAYDMSYDELMKWYNELTESVNEADKYVDARGNFKLRNGLEVKIKPASEIKNLTISKDYIKYNLQIAGKTVKIEKAFRGVFGGAPSEFTVKGYEAFETSSSGKPRVGFTQSIIDSVTGSDVVQDPIISVNEGIKSTLQNLYKKAKVFLYDAGLWGPKYTSPSEVQYRDAEEWIHFNYGKEHSVVAMAVNRIEGEANIIIGDLVTNDNELVKVPLSDLANLNESVNEGYLDQTLVGTVEPKDRGTEPYMAGDGSIIIQDRVKAKEFFTLATQAGIPIKKFPSGIMYIARRDKDGNLVKGGKEMARELFNNFISKTTRAQQDRADWKRMAGLEEVVKGDDFRFIEIKDLHFETDPDRLEDMKIEFGAKMGGITPREKIEDAEYELRRYRKQIKRADLGDGPHDVGREEILKKAKRPIDYDSVVKNFTPKWTDRKYEQWIEDVASGGGAEFAYDMAQNAKMEAGLIDWVKKNRLDFGDVTPLERIQYDIEALAESINEANPTWTTSPSQTGARGTIDTHTKLPKLKEKEFYEVGDIVEFPYGYSTHAGIVRDVDKRGNEDYYNWDYTVQMRGDEYKPGSRNYHDDEWNGYVSYPAGHKVYGEITPESYPKESVDERLSAMVKEVYSEKQRKWACAQVDSKSRPKGLSKAQAKEMCSDTNLSKNESMKNTRLQELIKTALKGPVEEESFPDLTGDGKVTKADILKGRGVKLEEGTDLVDKHGYQFTRFSMGEKGPGLQITGQDGKGDIIVPGSKLGFFASALTDAIRVFDDMSRQLPVDEDKVKGSNVRKDKSDGDWEVMSGKTGKPWPQNFKTKKSAKNAIKAYHASQNESLSEHILKKLRGNINEEEVSPEKAASKAINTLANKLNKAPEMDKLAAQVAKNPKLMAQLEKAVKAAGVNVELAEDESGLDMGDLKTMALNLAKKEASKKIEEGISNDPDQDDVSAGLGMAAFVGGGSLGATFGSTILAAIPSVASIFAGPALVGAAAGVGLFLLARKAYLMANPDL